MASQQAVPVAGHLQRLLSVRALLIAALLLVMLIVHYGFALSLPLAPLLIIIAALALLTLASWWRARQSPQRLREPELVWQLMVDVVGLTALLYFSGGWTNPLVSLYLVPIAVAVIMLGGARTWAIMAMTVVGYSLLVLYHRPVVAVEHHHMDSFTLHVAGMWLTFVLAAALITYFGTSMVNLLRVREQALAAEREENLRNEQIIGVATLAAGTAHELSTPLGSIAVIASELADQAKGSERQQLDTLLAQVAACRETLGRLRVTASGEAAAPPLAVDTLLEELGVRLALIRPRSHLRLTCRTEGAAPLIRPEPTLQQALLNLLDNAAAVSEQPVECSLGWDAEFIEIDIFDQGPGFQAESANLGSRDQGLGMGLLLANASIERLGGQVRLQQRPGGGAHVAVRLPLPSLQATP